MSHQAQREFVGRLSRGLGAYFTGCRVLEIGSLDINGSVREHFRDCEYSGLDIMPGPGVDIVCEGQNYNAPDCSFDHVVSCEAMEHNPFWRETIANMVRLCKPGGLVTITCASKGRREHGTLQAHPKASPLTIEKGWNYYRNLSELDLSLALDVHRVFSIHMLYVNWWSFDLYFAGLKRGPRDCTDQDFRDCEEHVHEYIAKQNSALNARYRSFICQTFGEWALNRLRMVSGHTRSDTLRYLHG